jgi:hypothetical protein
MICQQSFDALVEQVTADHRELHRRVKAICDQMANLRNPIIAPAEALELRIALRELREYVVCHFDREENGGCLEEAVVRMPHLAHEMTVVERQHAPLLKQLDAVIAELPDGETPLLVWLPTTVHFRTFARDLFAHEAAEEKIMQTGLNQPIET